MSENVKIGDALKGAGTFEKSALYWASACIRAHARICVQVARTGYKQVHSRHACPPTYAHARIRVHARTCARIRTCTHIHARTHIQAHVHTHVHVLTHKNTHICRCERATEGRIKYKLTVRADNSNRKIKTPRKLTHTYTFAGAKEQQKEE